MVSKSSKSTKKKQVREAGDRLQIALIVTAIFIVLGGLYSLMIGTMEEYLSTLFIDRINLGGLEDNFIVVSIIVFGLAFAASYLWDAIR